MTLFQSAAPGRRVRLFCLDPSAFLEEAVQRSQGAVFFSATLSPMEFFRDTLGGKPTDTLVQLPSPFPPEHQPVFLADSISTDFKSRGFTVGQVIDAIQALVGARRGNYLVYFPSYQYLEQVRAVFDSRGSACRVLVQSPGMTEPEREVFLSAFTQDNPQTLVGFAVMGGVFGEGIDLVGERLIGAIVVGVGLPQLCCERDLIRDYFQDQTRMGFEYAYTFPGMNRVLQAVGRVIRSETDRGVVLLIDTRFAESRYRALFPPGWRPVRVRSVREIQATVRAFWQSAD
jgi:DNA excision repair protein ERCC-2